MVDMNTSQAIEFGGKLKYRQTIGERQFSMPTVNASYLREEPKEKLSSYFIGPPRKDIQAELMVI